MRYLTPTCFRELPDADKQAYIERLADGNPPAPGAFTTTDAQTYIARVRRSRKVVSDFSKELDKVLADAKKAMGVSDHTFDQFFAEYMPESELRKTIIAKYEGSDLDTELDQGVDVLPLTAKLTLKKVKNAVEKQVSISTRAAKRKAEIEKAVKAKEALKKLQTQPDEKFPEPAETKDHNTYLVACVQQAVMAWTADVGSLNFRFMTEKEIKKVPDNAFNVPLSGTSEDTMFQVFCSAQLELGEKEHAPAHASASVDELVSYVVTQSGDLPTSEHVTGLKKVAKKKFEALVAHFVENVHPGRVEEEEELATKQAEQAEAEQENAEELTALAAKVAADAKKKNEEAAALKLAKAEAKNAKTASRKRGNWFTTEELPDPQLSAEEETDL